MSNPERWKDDGPDGLNSAVAAILAQPERANANAATDPYAAALLDLRDAHAQLALAVTEREKAVKRIEKLEAALRAIRGFDDTWAHRGHEPHEAGHECRMCWITKTAHSALAAPTEARE